jgi:hypothetical protein
LAQRGGIATGLAYAALTPLALALWLRAARTGRAWLAPLAAFLLGAALWSGSEVLGWAFGLAVAAAAGALPFPWAGMARGRRIALIAACAALFLLLQVPFIMGINRNIWETWIAIGIARRTVDSIPGGLAHAFMVRLEQEAYLIEARGLNMLPLAALGAMIAAISLRSARLSRRDGLPWILLVVYFVLSAQSPSHLKRHHLLATLPIFWAGLCAAAAKPQREIHRRCSLAALGALVLLRAGIFIQLYQNSGPYRDEWYVSPTPNRKLMAYFEARPGLRPVILGDSETPGYWLRFASQGRIAAVQVDNMPNYPPDSNSRWKEAFAASNPRFVIEKNGGRPYIAAAFISQLARRGLVVRRVDSINSEFGKSGYDIYRLVDARSVPWTPRRGLLRPSEVAVQPFILPGVLVLH